MEFEIQATLPNELGRAGIIKTAHGEIKTPAFMSVGTHGHVRFLSAQDLHDIGAQAMLSNGYHLRRQAPNIAKAGGLADWLPDRQDGLSQPDYQNKTCQAEPDFTSPEGTSQPRDPNNRNASPSLYERIQNYNGVEPSLADAGFALSEGANNWADAGLDATRRERPESVTAPEDNANSATPWLGPTLTDSGGFQVMSLGSGLGKVVSMEKERHVTNTAHKERLAHVSEKGVAFTDPFDGQPDFIGPEDSMRIQCQIGADIHMAFDELTSLADTYEYNVEAMERTERWAMRSLAEHIKHRDELGFRQNLYAVLQGGRWEDLRRRTAKNLAKMNIDGIEFDGFGLGGAFLKEDLSEILRWCNEELPASKPRHLLGLSHPDDIFIGTEMGADTFDCVAPTREARHGKIYTRDGNINLRQMANSGAVLDPGCDCPTCRAGWTRGSLRAMWRSGDSEQKRKFYRLASLHNLRFIIRLTEEIRASLLNGSFTQYKTDFLHRYYHS